jgi:hypothetical protein
VGEWSGMVVGWVREQAIVVGSRWSCWSEEVGGEGARMGGRVRERVRVVGWSSEVKGGSGRGWWTCVWTWVVAGWGGGEGVGGRVRAGVGGRAKRAWVVGRSGHGSWTWVDVGGRSR